MIVKHIDRISLLKLEQVIDLQPVEQYLNRQRTHYLRPLLRIRYNICFKPCLSVP